MPTKIVIGQKLASLTEQLNAVNELISEFADDQDVEGQLEYVKLLEKQAELEQRIMELRIKEQQYRGVMVRLREGIKEYAAWLVEQPSSFLQEHYISTNSPLGRAVLGSKPGEQVSVVTPAGTKQVEILAIAA